MIVQGSFFSLYRDSQNSEGGVLFKYEKYFIEDKTASNKKHFPVYIQILKHSVKFIFQGIIDGNYYHSELFSLPLSANLNSSDNLTSILKSISYGKLDIKEIINKKENGKEYKIFTENISYNKTVFYSRLDPEQLPEEKTEYLTFKKILLDFLFDLEHSEIFKFSKFYENMEMRLKDNAYFNLIASKYLFLFYKKIFTKKKGADILHKILTKKYLQAAEQWHNLIVNINLEHYFDTEWLKNVETEYIDLDFINVLKTKEKSILNLTKNIKENQKKNLENAVKQSLLWNLRRYNFLNSYKLVSRNNKKTRIILSILAASLTFVFFFSVEFNNLFWRIGILLILLGIVLKVIINFNKSTSLMLNILFPRLLVAILSGWILFMATEELWKAWFDISFYYALLPSFAILFTILLFIFYEISNIAVNKINFKRLLLRALYLVFIATFYSAIIGIAGSTIMAKKLIGNSGYLSEYLSGIKYFPNNKENDLPDSPWTEDSAIFIKTLYLSNYINNNGKIRINNSKIFFINNQQEKYIDISSDLGIELGLITGEILIANDSNYIDTRTNDTLCIERINKIIDNQNNSKLKKQINKPISHNLFELMKYINAPKSKMKIFYEHEPVILEHKWTRFKIFPGMLLINTFIAMFFGIFFQLSVQEKTITEPI